MRETFRKQSGRDENELLNSTFQILGCAAFDVQSFDGFGAKEAGTRVQDENHFLPNIDQLFDSLPDGYSVVFHRWIPWRLCVPCWQRQGFTSKPRFGQVLAHTIVYGGSFPKAMDQKDDRCHDIVQDELKLPGAIGPGGATPTVLRVREARIVRWIARQQRQSAM